MQPPTLLITMFASLQVLPSALPMRTALAQGESVTAASVTATDSVTTVRFPTVAGRNLEGTRFQLPADLGAPLSVILIAFKREQQADVDSWMPRLGGIAARDSGVRVYELPTLNRGYSFMRSFIDGGMARGIPSRATREATITLYIDKGPFKRALDIRNEDQIVVLLVDRAGRVHWRTDGSYRSAAADELELAIADLGGPPTAR